MVYTCFLIVLTILINGVHSSNLLTESILYGLSSSIRNGSADNRTLSQCEKDLIVLYNSVNDKHDWALKVLDASGQPESSFLYGNYFWLGSHAFCVDLQNPAPYKLNYAKLPHKPLNDHSYPPYPLRYAVVDVKHNNTLQQHTRTTIEDTIYVGLCIPKSCNDTFVLNRRLNGYFDGNHLYVQRLYGMGLIVKDTKLLRENFGWIFDLPKVYVGMTILSLYVLFVLYSTYRAILKRRAQAVVNRKEIDNTQEPNNAGKSEERRYSGDVIECFDVYSNIRAIVTTKKSKVSDDSVKCMDGLRIFLMYYAILGHAIYYKKDFMRSPIAAIRTSETFLAQITTNGMYVVDGFFFVSGFLMGYTFFKKQINTNSKDVKRKSLLMKIVEYFSIVALRLVRFVPAYAVIIFVSDALFTYLRETFPIHISEEPDVNCDRYWWRNLLFINNLYPRAEMCLSWSYYLSSDMQFFSVSLFLLMLSTTHFKLAAVTVIGILLSSVGVNAYIFYSIDYVPTLDEFLAQIDVIYDLPWCRISPYLIGLITSYILVVKLKNKLEMRKGFLIASWIFFPSLNLWVLFGTYGHQTNLPYTVFYMSVSKVAWAVGLAWAVIACHTNNGGSLNRLLSFRIWIPFNRLSLCVYLLNPLINVVLSESSNTYITFSIANCLNDVSALFTLTYFVALFATALFEYPFIRLIKLYLKGTRDKRTTAKDANAREAPIGKNWDDARHI